MLVFDASLSQHNQCAVELEAKLQAFEENGYDSTVRPAPLVP
jgi:hypothetical protein